MRYSTLAVACFVLFGSWFPTALPAAETNAEKPASPSVAELQKQIDQLLEGQQQLQKELEEIKTLLTAKQGRSEAAAKPPPATAIRLNVHGEPFRGDAHARVAIVEYSDFDCSFCAKYAREIFPKLDQDYIKPGRIKYFFRDLPEPNETNALLKPRAARCAGEQGKFWEMHDLLFASQATPSSQDPTSYAQVLELDIGKFSECLSSGRYSENIRRSVAGAARMGIFGTPAFLIGTVTEDGDFMNTSKVLLGTESYEVIRSVVDELLTPPPPPPPK